MKVRAVFALVCLAFAQWPVLRAATVEVDIQNFAFHPNPARINVGDTILWKNLDGTTHTSTSGAPGTPDGLWNSGFLGQNQTFSHTFAAAGSFAYFCIPHSSFMQASVIVSAANPQPVVAITSPANNATIAAPGPVTITAEGSGATFVMVEFYDGAVFLDMDHDAPFSITANLAAGPHSLTAKATTSTGDVITSAAVAVTVNAPAAVPVVVITAPSDNSSFTGPTNLQITASATISQGSIAKVEFFNGSQSLGSAAASPFTISPNLAAGSYSLTAVATSSAGSASTSAPVRVTISASGSRITDPFPPLAKSDATIELVTLMRGLVSPLGLVVPDDNSGRLLIFDQVGKVYVMTNGAPVDAPVLDVQARLVPLNPGYDERGLLGLAAHPNFSLKPLLYTYTSEPNGAPADFMIMDDTGTNDHQGVIAEWKMDPAHPNQVDPSSRREILRIDKPEFNHNGGGMHFGPDGFLYISFGDGGQADDQGMGHSPGGNGQDLQKILGKLIRIDVDARTSANGQYGVPSDNPFIGSDALPEIYAYGFRNPYSWSFDRLTGELYLGDVGQNDIEEVDRVFKGGNYGWPIKEGSFYFDPAGTNNGFITSQPVRAVPGNLVDPIAEYDHSEGIAIVGGCVYHGALLPGLIGRYITGDLGAFGSASGRLFYLDRTELRVLRIGTDDRKLDGYLKGFGQDQQGELYVFVSTNLGPSGTDGRVLKIVPPVNNLIVSASKGPTNVVLTWSGGVGPYLVQEKESLDDSTWGTVASTADRSASFLNYEDMNVFRTADLAGNGAIPFTVYLTGAAERPQPVNSAAIGTGAFSLEGNTLHFDIRYSGLSGPAILAHIHGRATAAEAAGVLVNLAPFNGGAFGSSGTLSGSVTLTPDQKSAILAGQTYVNIHTDANKSGEIRGQIAPVVFTADLSGDAEKPASVDSPGAGSGTFMLVGNQLTFDLEYHGLSSTATLSHIHGPADEDAAAGVLVDLKPLNGGSFGTNGTIGGTVSLTPDQLAAFVDGLTYVNVHSGLHPAGEIRGQLAPSAGSIPLTAALSPASERPSPVTNSTAIGSGSFLLAGHELRFNIRYSGLSGRAILAHIHGPATAAQAAGVMINLAPFNGGAFNTNGTLSGSVVLTDDQRSALLEGKTYVNVHTDLNKSGEMRGQILPVAMQASLSGASERPDSVQTDGRGHATFLLVGGQLAVNATYSGLSAPAVAAHIHGPGSTADSVGVMVNLQPLNGGAFGASGSFAGTVTLTPDQLAALADRLTYMNVHTGTHGGGEIRGQISR